MADIREGSFVRNEKVPKWGIGKVLETWDGEKARVFFEGTGELVVLLKFLVSSPAPENNIVLSTIDRLRDTQRYIPIPNLENAFLHLFPRAFDDKEYLKHERGYKVKASEFMREHLSREALSPLLAKGDYASVCDLAKKAVSRTNLVHKFEAMAFGDGLKRSEHHQELFATALYDLLYGETALSGRFDFFVSALQELDACKWTTATYFLFLFDPSAHIFVKPDIFQNAAKSFAFDIGYTIRPEWACYQRIIDFVEFVSGQLGKREVLKPRDLIDVQGFIWCSQQ